MASYKRVPMVRDLEYFAAFLRSIKDGGRSEAEREIRRLLLRFESNKDKAVGKGKTSRLVKLRLKSLVAECERLCYETGIIEKPRTRYKMRTEDPDVALLLEGNPSDQRFRVSLLRRLIMTYRSFTALIFQIRSAPGGKIYASRDRKGGNFQRSVKRYNLDMTQWTFEASRDLATQLDLINWRMLDPEEVAQDPVLGKTAYVVYLTSTICRLSELQLSLGSLSEFAVESIRECQENLSEVLPQGLGVVAQRASERGYLCIDVADDAILIRGNVVTEKRFEEVVWHEYLRMTDRVPREPVYYCQLRDRVCETLRISDHAFDRMVDRMVTEPGLFSVKVSPGEGSVPMESTASRKRLPPKLFSDSYMVYLQMEKGKSV